MANPKTPTALEKISELQKEIEQLKQSATEELRAKIAEARSTLSGLETELADLTGQREDKEALKPKRARRASISDDFLRDHVLKVMALHGADGLNAQELAEKLNQDAPRVRKFLKDNPKVLKRQGKAKATKFFLP